MTFSWRNRNSHRLLQSQKLLSVWDSYIDLYPRDKSNTSVFLWELPQSLESQFDTKGTWSISTSFTSDSLAAFSSPQFAACTTWVSYVIVGLPNAAELKAEIPEFITYALEFYRPATSASWRHFCAMTFFFPRLDLNNRLLRLWVGGANCVITHVFRPSEAGSVPVCVFYYPRSLFTRRALLLTYYQTHVTSLSYM